MSDMEISITLDARTFEFFKDAAAVAGIPVEEFVADMLAGYLAVREIMGKIPPKDRLGKN